MELVFEEILGGTLGKLLGKVDKSGRVRKFISKAGKVSDGIRDTAKTITYAGDTISGKRTR